MLTWNLVGSRIGGVLITRKYKNQLEILCNRGHGSRISLPDKIKPGVNWCPKCPKGRPRKEGVPRKDAKRKRLRRLDGGVV
jgi:hypothetical protein